jgi:hypothetical protein
MLLLAASAATAAQITFSNEDLLASYRGQGLIPLDSIGTWNGKPVSDINRPTDYERTLAATINFFDDPTAENRLFVQITNVVSTHFGYAFGTAFVNTALTGVDLSLKPKGPRLQDAVLSTD